MSHFYGTLNGSRGEATRCGTKASGIEAIAASWSGAVRSYVYERGGKDYVRLSFTTWQGAGRDATIYDGPINPTDADLAESFGQFARRLLTNP